MSCVSVALGQDCGHGKSPIAGDVLGIAVLGHPLEGKRARDLPGEKGLQEGVYVSW